MHLPITVVVVAALMMPVAAAAQTPSVSNFQFDPAVIPANDSDTVRLEITVTGHPTQVLVSFSPGSNASNSFTAHDDGTNGDRVAGDQIYTVLLPTSSIVSSLRADDVHRAFIGALELYSGATQVFQASLFADVDTSEIPTRPITRLSQFVQATDHLVNVNDAAFDPSIVTRDFYQVLGDDYDFIALVSMPARFLNRDHFLVQNAVTGIGQNIFNNDATYGSAGRLLGISRFPLPDLFDGAETGFIHELAHQWINFLNFAPLSQSIPHWPVSTMGTGVMGISVAGGEGLNFQCDIESENGQVVLLPHPNGPVYNDFDLYLMGLLPPDQVRSQSVFADQSFADVPACTGQTYGGVLTPITVDDIVSHMGPRTPAAGQAASHFHVATILVTRDGLASPETMWLYSWLAERGELQTMTAVHEGLGKEMDPPFVLATGGRATLDLSIALPAPGFALTPTPAAQTVASGTQANFVVGVVPTGSSFGSAVTLSCTDLPAHATCQFTPAQVTPGTTAASAVLTVSTTDATTTTSEARSTFPFAIFVGVVSGVVLRRPRLLRRGLGVSLAAAVVAASMSAGCSPPPSSSKAPPNPSSGPTTTMTAPGVYVVNVTGTSGSVQATTSVSLTVH